MSWLARKLDGLAAAFAGAAGAMLLAQAPAFAAAYLQRLGGRLDEARDVLARIQSGEMIPGAEEAVRLDLARDQAARVRDLDMAYTALREAPPLWRPFALLREFDPAVAGRTLADFVPALPLDTAGLVWAGAGVVIAVLVWEMIKAPFALLLPDSTASSRASAGAAQAAPPPRRHEPHL